MFAVQLIIQIDYPKRVCSGFGLLLEMNAASEAKQLVLSEFTLLLTSWSPLAQDKEADSCFHEVKAKAEA